MLPIRDLLDRLHIEYEVDAYTSDLDVSLSEASHVGELIALLHKVVPAGSLELITAADGSEWARLYFANHSYFETISEANMPPMRPRPMTDEQAAAVASYLVATDSTMGLPSQNEMDHRR